MVNEKDLTDQLVEQLDDLTSLVKVASTWISRSLDINLDKEEKDLVGHILFEKTLKISEETNKLYLLTTILVNKMNTEHFKKMK